jgi:hypothetical protein
MLPVAAHHVNSQSRGHRDRISVVGNPERRGTSAHRAPGAVATAMVVAMTSAGAVVHGCSIYDSTLLVAASSDASVTEGGTPDASSDTAPNDSGADAGWCGVQPPPRPAMDDGTQDITFSVALHTLDFGATADAGVNPALGYDLDGVCTCPGPGSCAPYMGGTSVCDEEMGRDNSTGQLLNGLASQAGDTFNQDSINTNIDNGLYGLVVRVTKYNGGQNDTNVSVAIFVSDGTPVPDGGSTNTTPNWNGSDVWTLDSTSVVTGGGMTTAIPRFYDPNAYVAAGTLVASVDFPLTLGGGSGAGLVTINLTGGFVTATIEPGLGSYQLNDGQLVGRWATGELLAAISVLSLGGGYLCPDTSAFAYVKGLVCNAADVTASPTADASSPCSALSLAAGFTAAPAIEGDVITKTPGVGPCADAGDAGDCF